MEFTLPSRLSAILPPLDLSFTLLNPMLGAYTAMPQFTTTSIEEAQRLTEGGKRQKDLAAYIESVNDLSAGTAGKVVASEGETLSTVRRRLGDAARTSGKDVEIRRTDDAIYFWLRERRRRGRPRTRQA